MSTTYQSVVEDAAALAGLDLANLSTREVTFFNRAIAKRLRFCWDWFWWPPAMKIEQRYFRAEFNPATTYAQGAEVVYDYAYYRLEVTSSTGNLPTDATKWTALPDLDFYLPLAQDGETVIGTVKAVWTAHPVTGYASKLAFEITTRGIEFPQSQDMVPSIWVEFKTVLPSYAASAWVGRVYTAGEQVLGLGAPLGYEGDFYVCVSTTTATESPISAPAKWTKLEFPDYLAPAAAQGAYVDWLRSERRPQEAQSEEEMMYMALGRQRDNYPAPRR